MPFDNPVAGGDTLIRNALQSENFVTGISGWQVNRLGSAEFNSLIVRGLITVGVSPTGQIMIQNTIPAPLVAYYLTQGFTLNPAGASILLDPGDGSYTYWTTGVDTVTHISTEVRGWVDAANGVHPTWGSSYFTNTGVTEVALVADTVVSFATFNEFQGPVQFDGNILYGPFDNVLGTGVVGQAVLIANSAAVAAETVIATVAATLPGGHAFEAYCGWGWHASAVGGAAKYILRESSLTGLQLAGAPEQEPATAANVNYPVGQTPFVFNNTGATGSGNIVFTLQRTAGAGTVTHVASVAQPSLFVIKDIGPAIPGLISV